MGGSELNNKIFGYAERNVESAFEFAQRLVQVRDAQELTKLQADFVQAQMWPNIFPAGSDGCPRRLPPPNFTDLTSTSTRTAFPMRSPLGDRCAVI